MRKLATVRLIKEVKPIGGADNIELVLIDGWQCVAKKGEFKTGDKCIYFEIDSILPSHEVFNFMEKRKYRVKTIKLKKMLSQGLAMPLSIIKEFGDPAPASWKQIGADLTYLFGVKKHDPEGESEKRYPKVNRPWYHSIPVVRRLFKKTRGNFPTHITQKTDEERMQNLSDKSLEEFAKGRYVVTEKLDGTSATFIFRKRPWLSRWLLGDEFIVCSRNLTKVHKDDSFWWQIANRDKIESQMRDISELICKNGEYLIVQGEIIGPSIQGNKYKKNTLEFRLFNLKIHCEANGTTKFNHYESQKILDQSNSSISMVPVLFDSKEHMPWDDTLSFVERINYLATCHTSKLNTKTIMEGVVVRSIDGKSSLESFKYINPNFLLKHGE